MNAADPNPPTKASLKAWWNHFTFAQRARKEAEAHGNYAHPEEEHTVFGKPLRESLKFASVQISTANANGELYVWGYVPVVVAKCGLYLKENATEVDGTFRVSGSNKRMRDLQAIFETPPRYGKSLDWKNEHFTTHDVASVFRRYLTQMPEPVIPYNMYHDFREGLSKGSSQEEVINTYKRLIHAMPRANQYLLLYVLDLLSVFARKSDKNRMDASNLAVIFRPGILSHPDHELSPHEHQLSQRVLEFLIEHQDWFMVDVPPPPRNDSVAMRAEPMTGAEPESILPAEPRSASPTGTSEWVSDMGLQPGETGEEWPTGKSIGRRRTVTARSTDSAAAARARMSVHGDPSLSPVDESDSGLGMQAVTVTRSRTLPSRTAMGHEGSEGSERPPHRKVLKKPRPKPTPTHSYVTSSDHGGGDHSSSNSHANAHPLSPPPPLTQPDIQTNS